MTEYIKKEDAIEALMCYFIPPIYTGEQVDQAKNIAESIMDGVPTIEASEDCIDKYSALAELDPLSYEYKEIKELPSVVPSKAEPKYRNINTPHCVCNKCGQMCGIQNNGWCNYGARME